MSIRFNNKPNPLDVQFNGQRVDHVFHQHGSTSRNVWNRETAFPPSLSAVRFTSDSGEVSSFYDLTFIETALVIDPDTGEFLERVGVYNCPRYSIQVDYWDHVFIGVPTDSLNPRYFFPRSTVTSVEGLPSGYSPSKYMPFIVRENIRLTIYEDGGGAISGDPTFDHMYFKIKFALYGATAYDFEVPSEYLNKAITWGDYAYGIIFNRTGMSGLEFFITKDQ